MTKLFLRYISVGMFNTLIHWAIFAFLLKFADTSQAIANVAAFCVAATFSFFVNAKWTFGAEVNVARYLLFTSFLGALAALTGHIADTLNMQGFFTLIVFSTISLFCGFIYSKLIVFRGAK